MLLGLLFEVSAHLEWYRIDKNFASQRVMYFKYNCLNILTVTYLGCDRKNACLTSIILQNLSFIINTNVCSDKYYLN